MTNLAAVKLSADGRLCVFVSNTTAVVIDVSGWWGPGASSQLAPIAAATRLVDTRPALMPFGSTIEIAVPAGADAVAINLTVTGARAPGYLTAYPCGTVRPPTSNLNFAIGELISGAAMVAPGANGNVCVVLQRGHVLRGRPVRPPGLNRSADGGDDAVRPDGSQSVSPRRSRPARS